MRPTAENELPLSSWLADVGRRWYAWITAVLAVFQISLPGLLRLIRTLKPDRDPEVWVLTLLHGLQAGVVLALLVVLYKPRYATPGRGMHHAEPIAQSQERFIVYWRYVWVSWFLLYAMLMGFSFAVQNRIDAQFNDPKQPFHEAFYNDLMKVTGRDRATAAPEYQKKGDAAKGAGPWQEVNERYVRRAIEAREARGGPGGWDAEGPVGARLAVLRPMLRYRDLAENTLNNFQTLAIFLCYFALAPGPMPSGRRPVRSPTPYGIILLSLLAFLQFFGVLGDLPGGYNQKSLTGARKAAGYPW